MPNGTLTLICHGVTPAVRSASFPADEPLDPLGRQAAKALASSIRKVDTALTSPARRAMQTAEALGLNACADGRLADLDYGRWSGRSLDDVAADDPAGSAAWMTDPSASPHGGESIDALLRRAAGWLQAASQLDGRIVAVTHATVMRAVIVTALDAAPLAFWRIEMAPLGRVTLRSGPRGWTLLSITR